jgi:D-alanyl-D-alanine carboxypeptidase
MLPRFPQRNRRATELAFSFAFIALRALLLVGVIAWVSTGIYDLRLAIDDLAKQKASTREWGHCHSWVVDDYQQRIQKILEELGAPPRPNARLFSEATELVSVGLDIQGREQRLTPGAAAAWNEMKMAAEKDGEILQLVSAFRSVDYQRQIIERKLAAGQSWEQILRVSALPGFSEHHTGRTVDVTTPGSKVLEEEFENTPTFRWLQKRAGEFGFMMTYPRGNSFGIAYEPWHWTFRERR